MIDGAGLVAAVKHSKVPRLLLVGGAGSLEATPGNRLVDTKDFPVEYRAEALAGCRFLETLRLEQTLDWTFLSPSVILHSGAPTGRFRLGTDALLVDPQGESLVSLGDFASALVDEFERPQHRCIRFTVGH